jgi:mitochondrial fission protein ELM1
MITESKKTCWVITDGKAGMVSQATGIAEAIGFEKIITKQCSYGFPWWVFPAYWGFNSPKFLTENSDSILPPWPDVLVISGTRVIGLALYIRKQSKGKTFTIYVQNPRIDCKYFDLVIPMKHDHVSGVNVIESKMALHKVTKSKLDDGNELHKGLFLKKKKPYLVVLIGGHTNRYKMNKASCQHIIIQLQSILANSKGSLFITPSRRTPAELIKMMNEVFRQNDRVVIVNPEKNNPYFGMLGTADCVFVTDDSVSMISEACSTGKKVYVLPLLNHKKSKPKEFALNLSKDQIVEIYKKEVSAGNSKAFNETLVIANQIQEILIRDRNFKQDDFIS